MARTLTRTTAAGELLGRGAAPSSGLKDNYTIPATRVGSPKLQGQKAHRKEAGQQQDLTSTHFKPEQSPTARPVLPAQDGCTVLQLSEERTRLQRPQLAAPQVPSAGLTPSNYAVSFEELLKRPNTQQTAWSLINSPGTGDSPEMLCRDFN